MKYFSFIFILFTVLEGIYIFLNCSAEKIRYISVEHPNLTYFNPKFFEFLNISSRRHSRKNPVHYFHLHFVSKFWMDNRLLVDFYFYEWLTNVYKPSFVEMHFKWCDLIHKDKFFGVAMNQGNLSKPCPYPPGAYHLYNMSIPAASIPRQFPFTRGRIYANVTWADTKQDPIVWAASGYVNMEIKIWNRKD